MANEYIYTSHFTYSFITWDGNKQVTNEYVECNGYIHRVLTVENSALFMATNHPWK